MVINKDILIDIEKFVGHNCTAQVSASERGLRLIVVSEGYVTEMLVSFSQMYNTVDQRILIEKFKTKAKYDLESR